MKEVAPSPDEEIPKENHMLRSQEPPHMNIYEKIKPSWAHEIIQEEEMYGAPEGSTRQSKRPKPIPSFMDLMCDLVDKEPTCFEAGVQNK